MQTYSIIIDDQQRQVIAQALAQFLPTIQDSPDQENNQFLLEMFEKLADLEKEQPGVLHGFCY